ncbi:DEAD/DEAH box helicase [Pseudoclavibacter chungangensis]|uniref:DEAD/DEAH box helicase n=1 Tax=Pseudoclavibacter chungangensis TaxID=587635 RepID=A0A7J5BST4_9MICO|nr:DEAD/DEAH box helicase [Pseudoclavibacter chungangensis]KAB1657292.1 DEAD/DEAH box helicase [Pseudoclavibacter chungangensis]NYJ66261.1 superfamily II DNA or RNA helicase [Pseudoclavibacter chungangensis]
MSRHPRAHAGGATTSTSRQRRPVDNTGVIPQLAKAAREVEAAAQRGRVSPSNRIKFQVIALLMREERQKAKEEPSLTESERAEALKRLDGLASILAKTAARDTSLIALLQPEAPVSEQARALRKQMLFAGGVDVVVDEAPSGPVRLEVVPPEIAERQVVPVSVTARVRSNPFHAPRLDLATPSNGHYSALSNWELLGPILRAFETGAGGGSASMELPQAPRFDRLSPTGRELMPHQVRLLESVRQGHRSYLLADEPGLGKTAQSVLAASIADAYPLLCVVPNVVKTNWAREVERWTPRRRATVISGDGRDIDAFADVFVVNYEILDRHLGWLQKIGFKGMVVDEAHFIKNLASQRSRLVMQLANHIRGRVPGEDPLLMALTGTPLINDVDDFKAIWQFLGWLDGDRPAPALMERLEENGLVPSDAGFLAAARRSVIDMGIVRRRKIDVAADLPSKRVVDMPVELDGDVGRSVRAAERALVARLLERYERMIKAAGLEPGTIDDERVRMIARQEVEESKAASSGESIFTMLRKIGGAKAELAAEYAGQLARSAGKVVFFAKHIEVMDRAEQTFAANDIRTVSIRGDQSATARQAAIDAFQKDPEVQVIVCSLLAAGVGINLQASSDVVLAELSWTAAEQTQAIDRVHRIGQEEPVTAWRIVASQTIDARIAELIDAKQGLAARALDGSDEATGSSDSIQVDALASLLLDALRGGR